MIVDVPGETPHTVPVADPTVAIEGLPLLHVPPGTASLSVMGMVGQKLVAPVIAAGTGKTVTEVTVLQLPPSE